ncbi:MAG: DUF4886 domain-containing protein [Niabella sp.]
MKKVFSFVLLFLALASVGFAQSKKTDINHDGIIKILAIGNSFSEDALDNYLTDLAIAGKKKLVIGNLYIGGASLEQHLNNAREDVPKYRYTTIDENAKKTITQNTSIAQALASDNWDYISFQQASPLSGKYDVINASLPGLVSYVRAKVSPETRFVYHQTWAYQHDSKHDGFKNYDRDQMTMYKAIRDASRKVYASRAFQYIVPVGTAIQNARTSSIGDAYTRDGYHLQLDYGRFTAACVWYEKLFKEDVRKNPYKPKNVTALQAKIAKQAAHKAVRKPYKVSRLKW